MLLDVCKSSNRTFMELKYKAYTVDDKQIKF